MIPQQKFSPGLLYAISPNDFAHLHLNDESENGDFDWYADGAIHGSHASKNKIAYLLRLSAIKWGIFKE